MDEDFQAPDLTMFLASAVHDMKNSIGMMSGVLGSLLLDESIKTGNAHQQITHLLYETGRMNNNLIQLLALYKEIGTAAYPFDLESQVIANFADEIASRNKILIDAKAISFVADFPIDTVWYFDEDLVLGVVSHAINNAIHYTRDKIMLQIVQKGDYLEIRVEDNGAGYPPGMLEVANVTEMSAAKAINFTTNCTGLGLHFSAEVAKMHKHRGRVGSMRLENGGTWGGACFVLCLP